MATNLLILKAFIFFFFFFFFVCCSSFIGEDISENQESLL